MPYKDPLLEKARQERRVKSKYHADRWQKIKGDPDRKAADTARYRKWYRAKEYGVDSTAYQDLLERQNGVCAICKKPPKGEFCIDHCHKTKKVRGLLCRKCNVGIGQLNDDPRLLASALEYLLWT